MTDPILVSEFDLGNVSADAVPCGVALVAAAREVGDDRVVVHVHPTADEWPVVHARPSVLLPDGAESLIEDLTLEEARKAQVAGGRLGSLEEVLLAAHRARVGVVVRVTDPSVLGRVGAAIGVTGGGPERHRGRFLVVVPDQRVGRRLRADAPDVPSALQLGTAGGGPKGWLRRRFPNLARAGADCDDLVVPQGALSSSELTALSARLASRGSGLWVSGVDAEQVEQLAALPLAGLLVRRSLPS